jgi:hypothetical protein
VLDDEACDHMMEKLRRMRSKLDSEEEE